MFSSTVLLNTSLLIYFVSAGLIPHSDLDKRQDTNAIDAVISRLGGQGASFCSSYASISTQNVVQLVTVTATTEHTASILMACTKPVKEQKRATSYTPTATGKLTKSTTGYSSSLRTTTRSMPHSTIPANTIKSSATNMSSSGACLQKKVPKELSEFGCNAISAACSRNVKPRTNTRSIAYTVYPSVHRVTVPCVPTKSGSVTTSSTKITTTTSTPIPSTVTITTTTPSTSTSTTNPSAYPVCGQRGTSSTETYNGGGNGPYTPAQCKLICQTTQHPSGKSFNAFGINDSRCNCYLWSSAAANFLPDQESWFEFWEIECAV